MTRGQIVKFGALGALVACAVALLLYGAAWRTGAHAASAYAARVTCSCRYVSARSAQSCARDTAPDVAIVQLEEDATTRRVSGRVPLLGSASARFVPGWGCLMEP